MEPGDRLSIDRVHFEVVHALHSGKREPIGPEGPAIGCVIEGSRTVYFAGDTDLFPEMDALADRLDVALLPVWGWGATIGPGHMDPQRAAEAVARLRPRLAIPIHWGTLLPGRPPGLDAEAVRDARPVVRGGGRRARARRPGPAAGPGGVRRPRPA